MATVYWLGTADAVAQVSKCTVGGTLSGETFTISIGGDVIATHTDATTLIADTVAALVSKFNASTHPYKLNIITASDDSPDVVLTSDVEGLPFTVTLNTPGGSATFTLTTPTANAGPHVLTTAANYSGGSLPGASDWLVFSGDRSSALWDLDGLSAVDIDQCHIMQDYTGKIGLDSRRFAISANGETYSTTTKPEYRCCYLTNANFPYLYIGVSDGPTLPAGSSRVMVNLSGAGSGKIFVHNTARTASETPLPAVRLLTNKATLEMYVRSAPGGVGIAVDAPDETSTIGTIEVGRAGSETRVQTGYGVTLTTWKQDGGSNRLLIGPSKTVTTILVNDGTLQTEESGAVTTCTVRAGGAILNHHGGFATAITTLNCEGGTTDFTGSRAPRTVTTCNLSRGATLKGDDDVLTIGSLNEPDGPYTLVAS